MDAHSFRILAKLLAPLLDGARIDKIYGPLPDLTVFHCFGTIGKLSFAVQTQKQQPRYFLQRAPLPNPSVPAPEIMRLRKYLVNAHFGKAVAELASRTLALPVMRHGETLCWLLCSPSRGILLRNELPANFPHPLAWPDDNLLEKLLEPDQENEQRAGPLDDPATWLAYPALTPLLRKTLEALDKPEAMALMVDLEAGGDTLFFYGPDKEQPTCYYAWPLPHALCKEAGLVPIDASLWQAQASGTSSPGENPSGAQVQQEAAEVIHPHLALASFIDEQNLQATFSQHLHKDDKQNVKRERKRLRRKERALEQEAIRLQSMVSRQKDARLIQENLWRLDPEAKYENLTLTSTLPTGETETRTIPLDPGLSIRDNMLEIFKKAEKGKRGLAILAQRRRQTPPQGKMAEKTETTCADNSLNAIGAKTPGSGSKSSAEKISPFENGALNTVEKESVRPNSFGQTSSASLWHNLVEQPGKYTQKNVAVFRSSDGYTILRGKNAQGNRQILKLGKPHDMWLHVQDGSSAHAIIKRDHGQDEVPESTIMEAARLVAEKSWLKENDSAEVMLALVKNVQNIKGAAAGTVKVDKILQTVYIKRRLH